jgi:hypothetical protein
MTSAGFERWSANGCCAARSGSRLSTACIGYARSSQPSADARLKYLAVPALAGLDPLSPGCEMPLAVSAALAGFALDTALRAWFRAYNTVLLFGFFGLLAILLTALLSPGVQRNAAWLTFYSTGACRAVRGTPGRADGEP